MFISRRGTVASAMSWGTPCPSHSHAIGFAPPGEGGEDGADAQGLVELRQHDRPVAERLVLAQHLLDVARLRGGAQREVRAPRRRGDGVEDLLHLRKLVEITRAPADGVHQDEVRVLGERHRLLEVGGALHERYRDAHDLRVGLDLLLGGNSVIVNRHDAHPAGGRPRAPDAVHRGELGDGGGLAHAGGPDEHHHRGLFGRDRRRGVDRDRLADPLHDGVLHPTEALQFPEREGGPDALADARRELLRELVGPQELVDALDGGVRALLGLRKAPAPVQALAQALDLLQQHLEGLLAAYVLEDLLLLLLGVRSLAAPRTVLREVAGQLDALEAEEAAHSSQPHAAVGEDACLFAVGGLHLLERLAVAARLYGEILHGCAATPPGRSLRSLPLGFRRATPR